MTDAVPDHVKAAAFALVQRLAGQLYGGLREEQIGYLTRRIRGDIELSSCIERLHFRWERADRKSFYWTLRRSECWPQCEATWKAAQMDFWRKA